MKPRRSQSSNRAEHEVTGEVLAASELLMHPPHPLLGRPYGHEDDKLWRCPNCKVQIFPRAWDDEREYQKTAYFTAHPGKHEKACKPEHRDWTPPAQGQDPRTPTELVSHLILTPASRGLTIAGPPLLPGEARTSPPRGADDHHNRSERHIAPACENFTSGRPDVLDAPLRIDRSPSQPYRHWFVRLGTGGPELLGTKRIFFGELRFTALRDSDWDSGGSIRIPLHSFFDGRPRHLLIDAGGWPEPLIADFRRRLIEVMRTGRAVWRRRPDRPYVFFLAEETDLRQADYHVRSEACVFPKLCTVPDLGRPGRRYPPPPTTRDDGVSWGDRPNRRDPWPGRGEAVPETPSVSEAAPSHPAAAAFTRGASHADGDESGAAEAPAVSPDSRGHLPDPAEPDEGSAPPGAEGGDAAREAPTTEPAATPSASPGAQRPSTPRPVHPAVQPSIPSYLLRAFARIAEVFRGRSGPPPPSVPPAISGTPD